jgi:hypothetical protein
VVITDEQAMKLLIESNPIPDISTLDVSVPVTNRRLAGSATRNSETTEIKSQHSDARPTIYRRRLVGIAAVVAAVAAVVLTEVFLFQATDDSPVVDQPSTSVMTVEPSIGLPGLPPEGAEPSSPENGELVASMWEHIGAPGSFGNGWLYTYADGRLIWERLDPQPTGGWLEQRLSPEGVDLIRSEILDTGLFEPDQAPPEPNGGFPRHLNGGTVQVVAGDGLVYLNHVVPDLFQRLSQLWSWLPDRAWDDTEAKAYVPSRYAVCLYRGYYVLPADMSNQLNRLPEAARSLLFGARHLDMAALAEADPAGFELSGVDDGVYCFDISTEEARTLVTALDDAGVEEWPERPYDGSEVSYFVPKDPNTVGGPRDGDLTLTLWPILPHGVPAFTGA